MTVNDSLRSHWESARAANDATPAAVAIGGGDGQPSDMQTEIALLKQRADQADQRMERMDGKLDQIMEGLRQVSTKEDVREAKRAAWQALGAGGAIALGIVAVFVAVLAYPGPADRDAFGGAGRAYPAGAGHPATAALADHASRTVELTAAC